MPSAHLPSLIEINADDISLELHTQSITNDAKARAERKEPINASSTTRNGLESGEREIIVVTRCY